MELNNINGDKREENTGFKTELLLSPDEEKRRAEAMANIFGGDHNGHHNDFFDRAGENDTTNMDNRTPVPPDDYPHRNNFDIRSEFGSPMAESIPDVNIYQNKKTVAQGMMDLALFSANANQLRYVLESVNHPYYYSGIVLIAISLIFQVAVGVGLLINTRYSVKCKREICIANKINNFTIVGIFLVTVINVFISAFGVATNGSAATIPLVNRFGEEDDMNITTTDATLILL